MATDVVNRDSFWMTIFEEHGSAILAFLTSRVGRRELAEDLLQETFVRAMRRLGQGPAEGNVRSYLFTTAHHLIVDHKRRKRPTLVSEMVTDDSDWLDTQVKSDTTAPDEALDLARVTDLVDRELQRLPSDHRLAFESAVLQQKPYATIAEEQGWTVNQVKINVYRARKKIIGSLRTQLRPGSVANVARVARVEGSSRP